MRLAVLLVVVAAADPARRALGKRKRVLRGPFGFRLSADELKHSPVRSTDHK